MDLFYSNNQIYSAISVKIRTYKTKELKALYNTGSQITTICRDCVIPWINNFREIDTVSIHGKEYPIYNCTLFIGADEIQTRIAVYDNPTEYDVIIGMDVISKSQFIVNGIQQPTIASIDFD